MKETETEFKLSQSTVASLNKHFRAIRHGVASVSELWSRDKKAHSLSKVDFEKAYIEKTLGTVIASISADIRGLIEVLDNQLKEDINDVATVQNIKN